jgi:hypothetical protein
MRDPEGDSADRVTTVLLRADHGDLSAEVKRMDAVIAHQAILIAQLTALTATMSRQIAALSTKFSLLISLSFSLFLFLSFSSLSWYAIAAWVWCARLLLAIQAWFALGPVWWARLLLASLFRFGTC